MAHGGPIHLNEEEMQFGGNVSRTVWIGLMVGCVGLLAGILLGAWQGDGWRHFWHSYIVQFMYFLSISLGALFFVLIQYLVRAGWSVVVRRLAEHVAFVMPLLLVLGIPLIAVMLIGSVDIYDWTDPVKVHADTAQGHLLHHKAGYLNKTFFAFRCVGYFVIWLALAGLFRKWSLRQDETGDPKLTRRMEILSAPGIILFALALTFAAFDFLMSLEAAWFSTIFGVYYFAGCMVSALSVLILFGVVAQNQGRLTSALTIEHYHDVGKLLFGFIVFWAYIGFSQFMLIWYGDIPEETFWYYTRMQGGWGDVSLALLIGHFFVPFLGFMSRSIKRNRTAMAFWAVYLLTMHWVDMYWMVMPSLNENQVPFHAMDIALLIGFGGLFVAVLARVASKASLVPKQDPRLPEALAFENY